MHVPATPEVATPLPNHFPLAQALSVKVTEAKDQGLDFDTTLPDAARMATGAAIAKSPYALGALKDWTAQAGILSGE